MQNMCATGNRRGSAKYNKSDYYILYFVFTANLLCIIIFGTQHTLERRRGRVEEKGRRVTLGRKDEAKMKHEAITV